MSSFSKFKRPVAFLFSNGKRERKLGGNDLIYLDVIRTSIHFLVLLLLTKNYCLLLDVIFSARSQLETKQSKQQIQSCYCQLCFNEYALPIPFVAIETRVQNQSIESCFSLSNKGSNDCWVQIKSNLSGKMKIVCHLLGKDFKYVTNAWSFIGGGKPSSGKGFCTFSSNERTKEVNSSHENNIPIKRVTEYQNWMWYTDWKLPIIVGHSIKSHQVDCISDYNIRPAFHERVLCLRFP